MDKFGRQRKDEEQLPERLHHDLFHNGCTRDLGIDVEVFHERLSRLK